MVGNYRVSLLIGQAQRYSDTIKTPSRKPTSIAPFAAVELQEAISDHILMSSATSVSQEAFRSFTELTSADCLIQSNHS